VAFCVKIGKEQQMTQLRDWLYIGNYRDSREKEYLETLGVDALLQLADNIQHEGMDCLYLRVEDGEPLPHDLLEQGIKFIREQKAAGKTIMVACGAGISRSATFCMAALMAEENLDIFEAYHEVHRLHVDAMPHYKLGISLAKYHGIQMTGRQFLDGLHQMDE